MFELIANRLLKENSSKSSIKMETFCSNLINKRFDELRQEIFSTESRLSSRLGEMEARFSSLHEKVHDSFVKNKRDYDCVMEKIDHCTRSSSVGLESERAKRLTLTKKLQTNEEKIVADLTNMIRSVNQDHLNVVNALNEDFRTQAREISQLKELLSERKHRRSCSPSRKKTVEQLSSSFYQGVDAGLHMDHLTNRINALEAALAQDSDVDDAEFQRHQRVLGSPLRKGLVQMKQGGAKMRGLESKLQDLRLIVLNLEADLQQVKSRALAQQSTNVPSSPNQRYREGDDLGGGGREELRALQKKVKKLGDSTSKACRSLSNGLTDVQQAALNLYSWSDVVHEAFGKVSHKLALPKNICPRARMYNPSREEVDPDLF